MNTIIIPKEFIREKELILVPRRRYEELLKRLEKDCPDTESHLWQKASKKIFLKSYDKSDSIYDKL